MKRFPACLPILVLFAVACVHEAAMATDPTPSPVIFPSGPPTPPTPPQPKVPTSLAADQIYLIRSSVELTVIDGTEGIVTVTAATGPMTIRSKFTDGTGIETRQLTDKYLYLVTAASTGKTDLIVTWLTPDTEAKPVAATKANKLRVCLDVTGPGPAPTPVPPTPPTPPGPVNPLTAALQAAYGLDADADKAKSLAFLQAAYAAMAVQAKTQTFTTNVQAVAWMKTVIEAPGVGLTATQVVNLRKAIGAELSAKWGTTNAPLAPADAASELAAIASALAGVR